MSPLTLTVLLSILAATGACEQFHNGTGAPRYELDIAGEHFSLEIADDDATRTKGLMGRREIAADGGMIFTFQRPAVQSFWMGNCLVDIDIIYLDAQGRVTALHRMKAEPPRREGESEAAYDARMRRYSSTYPAQFAIEFRAGTLDRLRLRVDSKVPVDTARLKAMAR